MQVKPNAYFDALVIVNDAPSSLLPMSVLEMHLFSYLGCVLALFQGKPLGNWGYGYAITSEGYPFSAELDEARHIAVSRSLLQISPQGLLSIPSTDLDKEVESLLNLKLEWQERRQWMNVATQCALALPVGSVRYAIGQSPGLATSLKLGQRKFLLEQNDINSLYSEYKIITDILGPGARDLLSPAVIWLSAKVLNQGDTIAQGGGII